MHAVRNTMGSTDILLCLSSIIRRVRVGSSLLAPIDILQSSLQHTIAQQSSLKGQTSTAFRGVDYLPATIVRGNTEAGYVLKVELVIYSFLFLDGWSA